MNRVKSFPTRLLPWAFILLGTTAIEAVPAGTEIVSISESSGAAGNSNLLFLGYQENDHHSPSAIYNVLTPSFLEAGVNATFTSSLASITEANLANYDALMMYGNALSSGATSSNQPLVPVIQKYVESGGALVGLHVAAAAFRNDPRWAALLGGRFQLHGAQTLTPNIIRPDHALMKGLIPLTSFDESYVLINLNPDNVMLQDWVSAGGNRYAWTWVRRQGLGRVFYSASAHVPASGATDVFDGITKPEFPQLVLRGLQWTTRRHFSALRGVSQAADGRVIGGGKLRSTGMECLWQDAGQGPEILAVDEDLVTLGGAEFTFGPQEVGAMIACPGAGQVVVFHREILNDLEAPFDGLWKSDPVNGIQGLAVVGQTFPDSVSAEIVSELGETVGTNFVANGDGEALFRVRLQDSTTMVNRSALVLAGSGIVLSEGDSHPDLPIGARIGSLMEGRMSLNGTGNFVSVIELSDLRSALLVKNGGNLSIIALESEMAPGAGGATWGKTSCNRINSSQQVAFITQLNGAVTTATDTALMRYSLANEAFEILLREGDPVSGGGTVGDLAETEFVMDQSGRCHFFLTLEGAGVSAANDQVLVSVDGATASPRVVVREGDALPLLSAGETMGPDLGSSPVTTDSEGVLYFTANSLNFGTAKKRLFQALGSTLLSVASEGDGVPDGPGTTYQISSLGAMNSAGDDDGYPSSIGKSGILATSVTSTAGHEMILRFTGTDDFDQDGLSNLLEAGIGSGVNDPNYDPQVFPSLETEGGQAFFTFLSPGLSGLPSPILQESEDLELWTTVTETPTSWSDQTESPAGFQRLKIPALAGTATRFLRVAYE